MKSVSWLLMCLAPFAVGTLAACSDDDHDHGGEDAAAGHDHDHDHDHHHDEDVELPPSCEAFHDQCLLAEGGNAEAEHCHELTHQSGITEAECAEHKDECIAACTGTPVETDAGTDAAPTPGTGAPGDHCEDNADCASGDCHGDHCH